MRVVITGGTGLIGRAVARDLGIVEQTLGNWVKAWRDTHADDEPPLSVPERIRLREAERELREVKLENEVPKKSSRVLCEGSPVTAKYAFIDATEAEAPGYFGIKAMCRWSGVSASGFFSWRAKVPSARARRRVELTALVCWSFERSRPC